MTAIVKGATTRAIPTDKMAMGASGCLRFSPYSGHSADELARPFAPLADIGSVARTEDRFLRGKLTESGSTPFISYCAGLSCMGG
jgi:hypothetical protein